MKSATHTCSFLPGWAGAETWIYLTSYSPQLNPEERLNAELKQEMGKRVPVRTKAKPREAANDHTAMLEQNSELVMSYFQDRHVRYAA